MSKRMGGGMLVAITINKIIKYAALAIYDKLKWEYRDTRTDYVAQCTRCNTVTYDEDAVFCPRCSYATLEEVQD